jgi:FkbM family methyltransferase
MFETLKLLNHFYKTETKGSLVFHKLLTYGYYFLFSFFCLFLKRGTVKVIFRNYLKVGFIPVRIKFRDGIIINHHLDDFGLFFEAILKDEYKLSSIRKGATVVDVGANIGLVSILLSKRFSAKKIISFEPNTNNQRFIARNISENRCENIELKRFAVSDKVGEVKLQLHGSGTHTISEEKKGKRFEIVNMTTLDKSVPEDLEIDLLKIDVEGAEYDVLKGGSETLKRTKSVMIEISRLTKDEISLLLKNDGFKVSVVKNLLYADRII